MNGLPDENTQPRENYQAQNMFLHFTGPDDIYIAYNLFIIFPILKSTLNKPGTTDSCNMYFQYTLLADILHGSSELVLQELTFLCNLFPLLQEVLCSSLHWCCQNVCLLRATLLLIGWPFVAGVDQCGDLWQGLNIYKYIYAHTHRLESIKRVLEIKVMQISVYFVAWIQEIWVFSHEQCCLCSFILHFSAVLAQKCSRLLDGGWTTNNFQSVYCAKVAYLIFSMKHKCH